MIPSDLHLLGARLPSGRRSGLILARKYEKPEMIGSIYVNPAWRTDNSRSLWEVIRSSPDADETLGTEVEPDWILVTSPNSGVLLDDTSEGEVFLLAASSVVQVIPWTSFGTPKVSPSKVLVRLDASEEVQGGVVVIREGARPTTGEITDVGADVSEEVSLGDRVVFTRHSGTKVEISGRPFLALDETAILAVIPKALEAHDLGGE